MGSGKSEAGRMLASKEGHAFVDLDSMVEEAAGRSVGEIFEEEGEAVFRARESEALVAASARRGVVVACGGGVVLDPANVELMRRSGTVVYLEVDPGVAARRIGDLEGRPLLSGGDVASRLTGIAKERAPLYASAAHHRVDAGGSVDETVKAILEVIRR